MDVHQVGPTHSAFSIQLYFRCSFVVSEFGAFFLASFVKERVSVSLVRLQGWIRRNPHGFLYQGGIRRKRNCTLYCNCLPKEIGGLRTDIEAAFHNIDLIRK